MSVQEAEQTTQRKLFMDDLDILNFAKNADRELKANSYFFSIIYSEVAKVDEGFYITPDLKIAVASMKHLYEHNIKDDKLIADIIRAALPHENAHAMLFPFMTRMNLTYAIVHGYCEKRGIQFNAGFFNAVENIISDIFNELVLYEQELGDYVLLPKLRYFYIYLPNRSKIENEVTERHKLERNPISALFTTHNLVFASLYMGKLKRPRVPEPKWFSEYIYNVLDESAERFSISDHIRYYLSGDFSRIMMDLIHNYNMYDYVDKFYTQMKQTISGGRLSMSQQDFTRFDEILNTVKRPESAQYWKYFIILTSFYRYAIENPDIMNQCMALPNIDTGKTRPGMPSPTILNSILNNMGKDLLSPELAEFVAKRLLSVALITSKPTFEETQRTAVVKIPWYRRPRGKIDPLSLVKPSILDWKVEVATQVPEYRRSTLSAVGVPDRVTVIIDESGSTTSQTSILSPIIGIDTSVFDVERTTIMSLLLNVMKYTDNVDVTLIRFSDSAKVEGGKIKEIYEHLKNLKPQELAWGGTYIEGAIEKGIEVHTDKPYNYFLLATDMEITSNQVRIVRDLVLEKIRRSPVLILSVNNDLPPSIEKLNSYPNVAAVAVKSMLDYPKLEAAIKKLAKLMIKG